MKKTLEHKGHKIEIFVDLRATTLKKTYLNPSTHETDSNEYVAHNICSYIDGNFDTASKCFDDDIEDTVNKIIHRAKGKIDDYGEKDGVSLSVLQKLDELGFTED